MEGVLPDKVRDYRLLMERWLRVVGRIPSLKMSLYGEAGSYPLVVVESEEWTPDVPSVYLSAGIHGDEPAPVEALLRWAEVSLPAHPDWNWQIFPCHNPWGLERNSRKDEEGRDLNRCFNSRTIPRISAQLALMNGHLYDVAACLHEDYDARGFYLYEITAERPFWGEFLCGELPALIAPDNRIRIDGHAARKGLIRRRVHPSLMKGHPEAFRLHFHHARRTYTLETPSEVSLASRVRFQMAFLDLLVKKLQTRNGVFQKKQLT